MKEFDFISTKDSIEIHDELIKNYGGIHGIRDKNLLESALAQPKMTIFGTYACKDIFEMAACYCYHIIKNHAFIDGNKRTGIAITLTFLDRNGYEVKPKANLYSLAIVSLLPRSPKNKRPNFSKAIPFK